MQKFSPAHPFPTGRLDSNNKKSLQYVAFIQFVCGGIIISKGIWIFDFLLFLSPSCKPTEMEIFLIYRYILSWLSSTVLCSPVVLLIETGCSEQRNQNTGQAFLSTLETATSIPPGLGITLAATGRFLSHEFHTNPFGANSSNTNTNTSFNTIQSLTLLLYRTEKALQAIVTAGIKTAHLVGMAGFGARI